MLRTIFLFSFVLAMPLASGTSTLLLRDGGALEGELLNAGELNRRTYQIKTADDLEISIDVRLVERIQGREREALAEYNRDAPLTINTVESHLYWARWCAERQLPEQARVHWQQILELDPEHVDARRHLGYTQTPTGWQSISGMHESRGRVLDRGRWRTPQELEVANFFESQSQNRQFWQGWIRERLRRLPNPLAEADLLSIRDPAAIVPIGDALLDRRNPLTPHARMLLLRVLFQIPDIAAAQTVAAWSVNVQENDEIRRLCIEEIQRQSNEHPEVRRVAVAVYRDLLRRNKDNQAAVSLVADALARVGGHEAVPELIEVLVVTVTETFQEQQPAHTFGHGSTGFQQGQRTFTQTRPVPNPVVLTALVRLTGINFEFNQDAWRNWYLQAYRSPAMNLRRI